MSINKIQRVGIVGAPFRFGQPKEGVEEGPKILREHGVIKEIEKLGWDVKDYGDLDLTSPDESLMVNDHPKAKNFDVVAWGNKVISDHVYKAAMENDFVLTLGGDHSIAIGTISGMMRAYKDLCVLWIDAHADINTPDGSISGNMHGMPVSYITGIEKNEKFSYIKDYLPFNRITYIGLRDVDEEEKRILKEYNIKAFSMKEVDKWGIGKVVEMALDHINPERDRPIHLSFDIDGIDSSIVPSTGTPVIGGLTFREGRYICEAVKETGKLVSMDLVEVNPLLSDQDGVKSTVCTSLEMIKSAFGRRLI